MNKSNNVVSSKPSSFTRLSVQQALGKVEAEVNSQLFGGYIPAAAPAKPKTIVFPTQPVAPAKQNADAVLTARNLPLSKVAEFLVIYTDYGISLRAGITPPDVMPMVRKEVSLRTADTPGVFMILRVERSHNGELTFGYHPLRAGVPGNGMRRLICPQVAAIGMLEVVEAPASFSSAPVLTLVPEASSDYALELYRHFTGLTIMSLGKEEAIAYVYRMLKYGVFIKIQSLLRREAYLAIDLARALQKHRASHRPGMRAVSWEEMMKDVSRKPQVFGKEKGFKGEVVFGKLDSLKLAVAQ